MITKAILKQYTQYKQAKYRRQDGVFVVEGCKMVEELLDSCFYVKAICATKNWQCFQDTLDAGITKYEVSEAELSRISNLSTPNQVWALAAIPQHRPTIEFNDYILVLDDIKDPGNLGTILRIADWFGIQHVVCSLDTVDVFNPKVVQATMGSLFRVNVYYEDLVAFFNSCPKNFPIYGTLLNGDNMYTKTLQTKGAIVIGNESHGISNTIKEMITETLQIPRYNAYTESLNASIAAAIVCAEFRRQKNNP